MFFLGVAGLSSLLSDLLGSDDDARVFAQSVLAVLATDASLMRLRASTRAAVGREVVKPRRRPMSANQEASLAQWLALSSRAFEQHVMGWFGTFGQALLEQVRQPFLLAALHVGLGAPIAIAANERWPARTPDALEQIPETGGAVLGVGLMAGLDLHIEHEAQVSHQISRVRVRGASGLMRVVADDGSFLMTVDRLDGDIDIEHPGLAEQGLTDREQVALQPGDAR